MWKILKHPLSVIGLVIGVGFNVLDATTALQWGLPISAWTAIGFVLFAIGIASVVSQRQKEIERFCQ
jgi:di/tricarboxylate transporter